MSTDLRCLNAVTQLLLNLILSPIHTSFTIGLWHLSTTSYQKGTIDLSITQIDMLRQESRRLTDHTVGESTRLSGESYKGKF